MKILFLDVDGVLNSEGYYTNKTYEDLLHNPIDRTRVSLVKDIVDSTGAKIVLTSTWRGGWDRDPAACYDEGRILNAVFAEYGLSIYDKTPTSERGDRPGEIRQWIKESCCILGRSEDSYLEQYIVIDDNDFGWKRRRMDRHVVMTSFRRGGLQTEHAEEAKKGFLERMTLWERISLVF